MARGARCRIVGRQALVVEEHASQCGAIVAQRVVGWGVVVFVPGLRKMRGQLDIRVAIGSGGELEGAPGGGPRRQRGCAQDDHQDQEGGNEDSSHSGLHGCRDGELDTGNLELVWHGQHVMQGRVCRRLVISDGKSTPFGVRRDLGQQPADCERRRSAGLEGLGPLDAFRIRRCRG
jgi:hypothetical protein